MSDETTTSEQLAEIEGQATDYTPPDGWRLLEVGETLTLGDEIVQSDDGRRYPTERVGSIVGANQRYIRRIERQAEPLQVREGRWRTRNGDIRNVTPTPEGDERAERWPWWDAADRHFWRANGRYYFDGKGPLDLVAYLGPIESEPQQEPQPQPADTAIEELRSEVSYVQNLLGESRQRVTHLEELVTSLQRELAVAKEELTIAAAVSQQLQIELDAAQQVPADTPELRRANDKLAQLEVLQPMAAACSTAQTMVRDMLGHMRCLLALHHTTDRSNFCTLLESILEVFDDVECDDDETSEAEQG
ncbi:MAG: hypothetical protein ACK528_12645 [Alphaproteobacteria bacterium]